jgi:hypothetical protein
VIPWLPLGSLQISALILNRVPKTTQVRETTCFHGAGPIRAPPLQSPSQISQLRPGQLGLKAIAALTRAPRQPQAGLRFGLDHNASPWKRRPNNAMWQ